MYGLQKWCIVYSCPSSACLFTCNMACHFTYCLCRCRQKRMRVVMQETGGLVCLCRHAPNMPPRKMPPPTHRLQAKHKEREKGRERKRERERKRKRERNSERVREHARAQVTGRDPNTRKRQAETSKDPNTHDFPLA